MIADAFTLYLKAKGSGCYSYRRPSCRYVLAMQTRLAFRLACVPIHSAALDVVRFEYGSRHSADDRKRGGDFCAYDFSAGRLTLAIGDALSKQSQGLRIARILRSFLASLWISSPSRILGTMSSALMEQARLIAPSPTFAAVLVASIDLEYGRSTYAAADVEAGMVFGDSSRHVHLGATGPLLGLERHPRYAERAMRSLPGNTLVAFTDGVTEAPAATPGERVGSSDLVRSMRRLQQTGRLTIRALWEEIDFITGDVYHDDTTPAMVTAPLPSTIALGMDVC